MPHATPDDPQIDLVYDWENAQVWFNPARSGFAAAHAKEDPKSWVYQIGLLLATEESAWPLSRCRAYIASVMDDVFADPIKVRASKDRNGSGYCHDDDPYHYSVPEGSNDEIRLHPYHRRPAVMLHEIAHALVRRAHLEVAGHGPEFAAVYLSLLASQLHLDAAALTASARASKVEVSDHDPLAVSPSALPDLEL